MDTYDEIIRLLNEMYKELKDDNDAYDKKQETQKQTTEETKNA